jgi:hypothetical protein
MGAVGYSWNEMHNRPNASAFKAAFVDELAKSLGKGSLRYTTTKGERNFNIFNWQGR